MKSNLITPRRGIVLLLGFALIFGVSCQKSEDMIDQNLDRTSGNNYKNKASAIIENEYLLSFNDMLYSNVKTELKKLNADITNEFLEISVVQVHCTSSTFLADASKIKGVTAVIPDMNLPYIQNEASYVNTTDVFDPSNISGTNPYYSFGLQWGHRAIKSAEAWEAGYTGEGAVVAVLDGGFFPDHPDIAANVIHTANFVEGETVTMAYEGFSHGTHVAGIVAAADNDIGCLGVAPDADLVLIKVLPDAGSGPFGPILAGMVYAANRTDVDIMNMSLGGSIPLAAVAPQEQRYFREFLNMVNKAVQYANQKGKLVIIAAGNDGVNPQKDNWLITPAMAPQAFAVSSVAPHNVFEYPNTDLDVIADYSNIGIQIVDVAGSGGNVDDDLLDAYINSGFTDTRVLYDLVISPSGSASYYWAQGTSMACPQVSGVAALIIGKYGKMSPKALKTKLYQSADDLGKPGMDALYGHGRVNAYNAVK